jgi:sugar (pentulose or hexulose) kinase
MTGLEKITSGRTYLGIEFGSTRIKAVLTDESFETLATGSHEWENRFENGIWTYSEDDIIKGLQSCYASLVNAVKERFGVIPKRYASMGISAMMHGYIALDENDKLLVPFRTWRNTVTEQAASELTALLSFNIPQRWTIAHLYQAVLNKEEHLPRLCHVTTLAGYVHYLLTGKRVVGTGEASGIFPVDGNKYNENYAKKVNVKLADAEFDFTVNTLFPEVLCAGENAGELTAAGAALIDPTGSLESGIPLCPPEGDAGTGMVATNSVLPATGNISAGTSIFAMLVLDRPLKGVYPEIDVVTTPDGAPVAMVHCNNCTAEIDAWAKILLEFSEICGVNVSKSKVYETIYKSALTSPDKDCGGVTAYNFLSGEPVAGVENGRPMYFRTSDSNMNFSNFFRAEVFSCIAALKMGIDILTEKENVPVKGFMCHGGVFKIPDAAGQIYADALNVPVSVMQTAGEGGAWGMAVLAGYMADGKSRSLAGWLGSEVFGKMETVTKHPEKSGTDGFNAFMEKYRSGLEAERTLGKISERK